MRVLILSVIMALPLMAFGQKEEQQQPQQQPQAPVNEAPATTEKEAPPQEATKTQTTKPDRAPSERKQTDVRDKDRSQDANKGKSATRSEKTTDERGQTDVKSRTRDANKSETETRSNRTTEERGQTDVQGRGENRTDAETRSNSTTSRTKVNVDEFRSRHSEVFNLGRHPKEFFTQRYGANHFREIGNSYFVFVDGCWVAVEVDGFGYTQRVICEGEPDFVAIVD